MGEAILSVTQRRIRFTHHILYVTSSSSYMDKRIVETSHHGTSTENSLGQSVSFSFLE
jgi:hypothetical protein